MIKLNGITYTDIIGLDSLVETIKLNDSDSTIEYGISNTLTATGDSYKFIYDYFYKDLCNSLDKEISVLIKEKCGELHYKIRIDGITLNECDCTIQFVLIYVPVDEEKYLCLKNLVSYGNNKEFKDWITSQKRSYKVGYCQDYSMITYAVQEIYTITIKTIVDVIQFICGALKKIGIKVAFCRALDNLENAIVGCNKYHTTATIKDIFEYWCKKCQLEFQSSIFQNDSVYKCTVIETAVGGEGYYISECNDSDKQWNENNAETLNLLQLAEMLTKVINGAYRVKNGKFILERKDYFDEISKTVFNYEKELAKGNLKECSEISIDQSKICAYLKLSHSIDALDQTGNKSINEYNEIIEWNESGNKNTKGQCLIQIPFAPSSWSNDERLKRSFESRYLANIRVYDSLGTFNTGSCDFTHWQNISDGQLSAPKLFVLDKIPISKCNDCNVYAPIKRLIQKPSNQGQPYFGIYKGIWDYNYPLKGQALYDRFYYIDDPKNNKTKIVEFSDIIWNPDDFCKAVEFIKLNGLCIDIQSNKYGKSTPQTIEINYSECSIKFTGLKFKCKND